MNPILITGLALVLAGLVAGYGAAFVTHRLPELKLGARPKRYIVLPVVFALTGLAVTAFTAWRWEGHVWVAVLTALLFWQLIQIATIDAENHWLPDIVTAPLAVTGLFAAFVLPHPPAQFWQVALLSGVFGFVALWGLAFIYSKVRGQSGLGGGDPILLGAGAVWVGALDLPLVMLVASLAGIGSVIVLRLIGRPMGLGSRIPYGTYLAMGFAIAWLLS